MPELLTHRPLPTALSQMYGVNSTRDPAYMASEAYAEYGDYQPGGHTGWDFKANHGDPVMAAGPGTLDFSGPAIDMPDWVADKYMHERGAAAWPSGNFAAVDHGDGKGTTYSHMSQWEMILDGSPIQAGQVIGYAGSSGRSTGTHCHFDVILLPASNQPPMYGRVDPLNWFAPGTIFQIRPGEEGAAAVKQLLIPGVPGLYK